MYRLIDNKDGSLFAICFSKEMAKNILTFSVKGDELLEDGETRRYVYEDCVGQSPAIMIASTLKQMSAHLYDAATHLLLPNSRK